MRLMLVIGMTLVLSLTACGSSQDTAANRALQEQVDLRDIEAIERTFHEAMSKKDVDLLMSLWAPGATITLGPNVIRGKKKIRDFYTNEAAPFQLENDWVSETPAYKIEATVDGDTGTVYFECHFIDLETGKVTLVAGVDADVARLNGRWVITRMLARTPTLAA